MKNYFNALIRCLVLPVLLCFGTACEKQHLKPDVPENSSQPMVFISAVLGSDSVYYAGGVDSYIGDAYMTDSLSFRYFNFYLYNEVTGPYQPSRCFRIYVNNASASIGTPEIDLDSTINEGTLNYQTYFSGFTSNAVTVDWYDSAGTKFTSALLPQSDNFTITSVEDIVYDNKAYKKVAAEFQCLLMEGNNFNTIPLVNGRAVLLFGTH